jgi:hypothetical protein
MRAHHAGWSLSVLLVIDYQNPNISIAIARGHSARKSADFDIP